MNSMENKLFFLQEKKNKIEIFVSARKKKVKEQTHTTQTLVQFLFQKKK